MKRLILGAPFWLLASMAGAQQVTQPPASNISTFATAGPASLTGATIETNITSIKIPANSLGKNGAVFASCLWSYPNSANSKSLIVRWSATQSALAGTLVGNLGAVTTSVVAQTGHILRNNNATNAQLAFSASNVALYGIGAAAANTGTVDTTADAYLNINGILALGSETLTVQHCFAWIGNSQ